MRSICWLAEELLASQEGISSTGLKKQGACLLPATCAPPSVQYEGAKIALHSTLLQGHGTGWFDVA
jgi:hypothetical protein